MQPRECLHRVVLFTFDWFAIRVKRLSHRGTHQDRIFVRQVCDAVDIAWREHFSDAIQNRVFRLLRLGDSQGSLAFVTTMMADPLFAQDLSAPLAEPNLVPELSFAVKRVCRSTNADDRLSRVHEFRQERRFAIDGFSETRANDHQVSGLERSESFQSSLVVWVDVLSIVGPSEHDGAVEAMLLAQNFGQHRHRFFGPILFVARHQNASLDDVSIGRRQDKRVVRLSQIRCDLRGQKHAGQKGKRFKLSSTVRHWIVWFLENRMIESAKFD